MYHFTFIEETSAELEQDRVEMQENVFEPENMGSEKKNTLVQKTSDFLHRYLDQPNCVRIFIKKN